MPKQRFERLGRLYLLALSGIAIAILASQLLIQNFISKQQDDSRTINVAGRQRMLSQKISKIVLQIANNAENGIDEEKVAELQKTVDLWIQSHNGLINGDETLGLSRESSATILSMFEDIEPHFEAIVAAAQNIIDQAHSMDSASSFKIGENLKQVLENEPLFLEGMDVIVFQYDEEAKKKVLLLKDTEIILFGISLLIIIFEVFFIFRPTTKNIRKTFSELVASEKMAQKMAREIGALYSTLEVSYQELADVDLEKEQAVLFAKCDILGNVSFLTERFIQLMEFEDKEDLPENIFTWLKQNGYKSDFLEGVLDFVKGGNCWLGELKVTSAAGDFIWIETNIVPVKDKDGSLKEVMVIGVDVTENKEARERSREINKQRIEEKVKEQQFRSVLILEGQEEERKRISRDMHDGVGQMLYALKLNLEATTPSSSRHTKERLQEARDILKNIIREVRRVSFNLTPTSLSDFGIVSAIKKYCSEVSTLMGIEVEFINMTRFINRLGKNVETHLYRIIQEAVNNAIKYSGSKKISVTFAHNAQNLHIEVRDNGKGFDIEKLTQKGHFSASGHGIFNMRERAGFINAQFDVETQVGKGTVIKIDVPIN
ncbi:type IV pili methyl-accepting chemotaxis transducer N-terminal domain-containing protein [Flexithrix dorotheae]|uniref:sensor histidine kinase n=1 Tax=Flexithrix dorotheae TaxID=70993 RepID=UPI00037EBCAF|nr:type IV pili methyl-accepting chemotaxis transducer N-terminal domain-containing protein [Flexithrix dorotheae]